MADKTGIIWTESTWNPVTGCKKITPGCAFCYADTIASKYAGQKTFPNGFGLTLRPHKLDEPLRNRKPTLYFVNSMSDLFWDEIPQDYVDKVLCTIEAATWHEFQVLTKRPERMAAYFENRHVPANFWAGTTIESAKYLHRLDTLRQVAAEIRFVSFEPLLGDLGDGYNLDGIHWVITGGESGAHLFAEKWMRERSMVTYAAKQWTPKPDAVGWVRSVREKCRQSGTHFFHKQWGGAYPEAAGRELDGMTYNEIPRLPGNRREINNDYLALLERRRSPVQGILEFA